MLSFSPILSKVNLVSFLKKDDRPGEGDITHPNTAISKEAGLQSLWSYDSGQLQGWEVEDQPNSTGWSGRNPELWVLHQGTQGETEVCVTV